jgi:uncharacterized protein with FMN-binding domain
MRKITMWFVATVAIVVLLFSYRTSTSGAVGTPPAAVGGDAPGIVSGGTPAPVPSGGSNSSASNSGDSNSSDSNSVVVNGSVTQTRWGPVQVQVRISAGKITDVTTLRTPDGNRRDIEINDYAVPQLRAEVLAAQSADIDAVSGATVTSEGYINSLQAALDSAHFKG